MWRRAALPAGFGLAGPAAVEQMDSTLVIPPGVRATVHESSSLILELA